MNDTHWYTSEAAIAFYIGTVIVLLLAGIVHAQEATNGPESVSGVGFWDTLGQWWDDFLSWFNFLGIKGDITQEQNPNTPAPLTLGWSNKNHTIMTDVPALCDTVIKECVKENCTHLEPCTTKKTIDVIDESWQSASSTGITIDLNRDYYWIENDGKVVGVSKTQCDGNLDDKTAIQLKAGCDYVVLETMLNEKHHTFMIADKQSAIDIRSKKEVLPTDAINAATMKVVP